APRQEKVLELVKRDYHWNLQAEENLHEDLEQGQHQILPARAHLEFQLRKTIGEETGQIGFVVEECHTAKAGLQVLPHETSGIVCFGLRDVLADQVAELLGVNMAFGAKAAQGAPAFGTAPQQAAGCRPGQAFKEELGAFLGRHAAQAQFLRPPSEQGHGEQLHLLLVRHSCDGLVNEPAANFLADDLQGPDALLPASAQKRIDHLKKQVFQEIGILLIGPRRYQHLPAAVVAMLDRVEQVGLARSLVAEHRHDFGMNVGIVSVQINDAQKLLALLGKQFRHMKTGTNVVVGVARKVVSKRVAGAP